MVELREIRRSEPGQLPRLSQCKFFPMICSIKNIRLRRGLLVPVEGERLRLSVLRRVTQNRDEPLGATILLALHMHSGSEGCEPPDGVRHVGLASRLLCRMKV